MSLIVSESEDFVIADKPHGIPTVPLKSTEPGGTLLGLVAEEYPEVMLVHGKNHWEGGAVHRLDTATGGLVIFARTQAFYNCINEIQRSGKFIKTYSAVVNKPVGFEEKTVKTYFRAYGPHSRMVKCETDIKKADSDVLYETKIKKTGECCVECVISRGFRHQIRAHLAYIGYPIVNDELYNAVHGDGFLELDCIAVEFDGFVFRRSFESSS